MPNKRMTMLWPNHELVETTTAKIQNNPSPPKQRQANALVPETKGRNHIGKRPWETGT